MVFDLIMWKCFVQASKRMRAGFPWTFFPSLKKKQISKTDVIEPIHENFSGFTFFFFLDDVATGERESWQLGPKLSHNVSGGQRPCEHISRKRIFDPIKISKRHRAPQDFKLCSINLFSGNQVCWLKIFLPFHRLVVEIPSPHDWCRKWLWSSFLSENIDTQLSVFGQHLRNLTHIWKYWHTTERILPTHEKFDTHLNKSTNNWANFANLWEMWHKFENIYTQLSVFGQALRYLTQISKYWNTPRRFRPISEKFAKHFKILAQISKHIGTCALVFGILSSTLFQSMQVKPVSYI